MASSRAAGHRRRNLALVVVAASVVSAAGGIVVGRSLQSPADAAAEAAPPEPSRITVPVERRSLVSRLIANGDIQYNEPTPLRLVGSVGASGGSTQIITKVPALDVELAEGDVALEVSGRPVFVFVGELPTYRPFEPGTSGPDVEQLEAALARLGFDPGPVDGVYDNATEAAVDAMYADNGYRSEGPSGDQRDRLQAAEKAVNDAKQALTRARQDLADAGKPLSGAELLRQQQAFQASKDAVPAAQATANRRNADALIAVAAAIATRDGAKVTRDLAKTARDASAAPGARNPDTTEPYTAAELATFNADLRSADQALVEADTAVARSISERDQTGVEVQTAIEAAADALRLAELTYGEALEVKDVSLATEAVGAAEELLNQASLDLFALASEIGTKMPAGEMVFLPSLPTTITQVAAEAGKVPADPVATVSGTTTLVQGRISASDADLVVIPTPVEIVIQDADVTTTGTLIEIRMPAAAGDQGGGDQGGGQGGEQGGGNQGGDTGRLTVVVEPDDPTMLANFLGWRARISITVSSTAGDVLAVPVAALSVGPDGDSRIEVEHGNGIDDVEFVKVAVGLSAEGYAEISPIGGASLNEGDRVVVGRDSGQRRRRSDSSSNSSSDTETTEG